MDTIAHLPLVDPPKSHLSLSTHPSGPPPMAHCFNYQRPHSLDPPPRSMPHQTSAYRDDEAFAVDSDAEDFTPLYIGKDEDESIRLVPTRRGDNGRKALGCFMALLVAFGTSVWLSHEPVSETSDASWSLSTDPIATPSPVPPRCHPAISNEFIYHIAKTTDDNIRCNPVRLAQPGRECHCADPTVGSPPYMHEKQQSWPLSVQRNVQLLQDYRQNHTSIDVLLLGDSITEHWMGTDGGKIGSPILPQYQGIHNVYREHFELAHLRGLALGIGGDRCAQLLYRIQHGELPGDWTVPVVWILVGTNDIWDNCSVESIAVGIWSVALEVAARPLVVR